MTKPKAGHRLNAEQRRAVEYRGLDPLLILAGAGTGKTDTLAHRAAHLVVTGTDPCQILLLTFTRRAADEMMQRVAAILRDPTQTSSSVTKFEWSGTFHAMGLRVLRQYAGKVGLKPNFTIHDQSAAADLIGQLRQDLGLAQLSKKFPDREACLKIYSRKVNARQPLKVVLASG